MAPKGTKGTKGKSAEGSKGKCVEDTQPTDEKKNKQPQLEETIEDVNMKNDQLKQALLGFARFDILEHRECIRFGRWNPRSVQPSEIARLVESFQVNGLDRFNPTHAMPFIVPKSLLKQGTYVTEVVTINNVPVLQINADSGKDWKIQAAGGQHRLYALEVWLDRKQKQLDEHLATEKSIKGQDPEKIDEADLQKWNKTTKKEKEMLEGIVAYGGQWLVSLFDESKIDEALAVHISRNETKHVYMESPMEGLVQRFKLMRAEGRTYRHVKLLPQSKGTAAKQLELLKQDYVWEMLTHFEAAGVHYWQAEFMQFTEFYNTMLSSYGGVLAYLVGCLECRMRMCFNTVEVDEKKVQSLISKMRLKKDQHAQDELEEIYERLKEATPVTEAISSAMREAINMAFETSIRNTTGVQEIGNPSSANWVTVLAQYASEVPLKMQDEVDAMAERGDLTRVRDHIATTLKTCSIKARILFACKTSQDDFSGFPFMSSSLFKVLKEHFSRIQSSILELSSWWSPYVYASKIHPKEWFPGSASADMRRAVWAHPDFHVESRQYVWDKIVLLIFESYPAFLNMEGQLSLLDVPDRSLSQSKLLGIFGMSLSGGSKPSKTSGSKTGKGKGKKSEDDDDKYGDREYVDGQDEDEKKSEDEDEDSSPNDDENEGVRKGESKQERLDRQEKAKVQAEARAKSLEMEAAQACKILINSRKVTSAVPTYCDQAWSRKSKISSDAVSNSFRGQELLKWHTWEWAALLGPSRTRILRILGCISIHEASAINHYRPNLLSDPTGGAATIRFKIETDTSIFRITRVCTDQRQTTLDQPKQRPSKVAVSLTWADSISAAHPSVLDFDLDTELSRHNVDVLRLSQQSQMQRIVNCIESQRVAWDDTTNTVSARDKPPLQEGVQKALEELIIALDVNAYRQRSDYLGHDQSMDDFSIDIDGLDVVYRAGLQGVSKSSSQKHTFVILSRSECGVRPEDVKSHIAGRNAAHPSESIAPLLNPTSTTKAVIPPSPVADTGNRFTPLGEPGYITTSSAGVQPAPHERQLDGPDTQADVSMDSIDKKTGAEDSSSDDDCSPSIQMLPSSHPTRVTLVPDTPPSPSPLQQSDDDGFYMIL